MLKLTPRAASLFLRLRVKRKLLGASSFREGARAFELQLPYEGPEGGFHIERRNGVVGERSGRAGDPRLLYLHGGAFFAGSPKRYRPITSFFARAGFDVFAPAYRLAPRHLFPAALDDARAAYHALLADGGSVLLAGDSAGGGLALSLMLAERKAGGRLPAAAALFSPWTDLAVTGESARANESRDPMFTRGLLAIAARAYLGRASPKDPLASPIYGDFGGFPPLLVHVGAEEMLRDDSTRLVQRAVAAGVSATLAIWPGVPHCWQLATELMPEGRRSLEQSADFLSRFVEQRGHSDADQLLRDESTGLGDSA